MNDIRKLTEGYVAAFNARNLDEVAYYLAERFELTDPEVTALSPKVDVLKYIGELFDAQTNMSFEAHLILIDDNVSVIHFTLTLGTLVFDGVDIITWEFQKMTSMKAYLTPRK